MLLEKPVAVDYAQSLRLVDAVARLDGRLLVGHHRRHHPAIARARARDPRRRDRTGGRRQRTLVGAQGGRLLHRHALAPPARRRRDAHQRRARPRSAASPVRRGRRDPGDAELARARPRGRRHRVAEPQVRKRRGRQLPRLRCRRLAVGLGPVHRGDARVPVHPGRRRLSARRHPRRAVGAQPREVLVRPVGVRRTGTLRCRAPTSRSRRAGRSRRSSTTSSRSPEGRRQPLVSAEDASRTLALVEAAALAARTGTTVDVARFRGGRARPDRAS